MTLLIVFHILVCAFLVFVILLQPGKADAGIGFGSSSQSIFGSRGASNFLTKTTSICAVIFLLTSFVLTRSRIQEYDRSVIKNEPAGSSSTATPTPAAPTAPAKTAVPKASAPATPAPVTAPKSGTPAPAKH